MEHCVCSRHQLASQLCEGQKSMQPALHVSLAPPESGGTLSRRRLVGVRSGGTEVHLTERPRRSPGSATRRLGPAHQTPPGQRSFSTHAEPRRRHTEHTLSQLSSNACTVLLASAAFKLLRAACCSRADGRRTRSTRGTADLTSKCRGLFNARLGAVPCRRRVQKAALLASEGGKLYCAHQLPPAFPLTHIIC